MKTVTDLRLKMTRTVRTGSVKPPEKVNTYFMLAFVGPILVTDIRSTNQRPDHYAKQYRTS
jgi:hypothetical protein